MLVLVVTLIIIGLIAGALARLVVPGKQHLSILGTILLGIVGSFVGGFVGYLLFHHHAIGGFLQPAGIIGSIIGSIIVLIYLRVGGSHGAGSARGTGVSRSTASAGRRRAGQVSTRPGSGAVAGGDMATTTVSTDARRS
jgi:uncharacterized membrane protein YeaQ/YmgE (transglycosylase-associated protein family)